MNNNMERHHAAVWGAIETVAATMGISVSRLAILAEHHATAMVSRIINVAGISFTEFGAIVDQKLEEQA